LVHWWSGTLHGRADTMVPAVMDAWTQDTNGVPGFMGQAHKISFHWAVVGFLFCVSGTSILSWYFSVQPSLPFSHPSLIDISDVITLRPRMYRPQTQCPWEASSKGCFVRGTCRPRDALSKRRIIRDFLFGDTSVGDTLLKFLQKVKLPRLPHQDLLTLKGLSHEIDFKNFDKKLHNLA
jgi:hypothetical protein